MPTSLPRGWLLGFSLWFASTAWLYAYMSRAQAEQSWELAELRREMSELHREVISCQLEKAEARLEQGRRSSSAVHPLQ